MIKKILIGLLLMVVSFLMFGAVSVWPFFQYPRVDITIDRKASLPPLDVGHFMAGIAVRDITPPVGIPKMGYSAWARDADGFRNRLKTRVFYMKPAQGQPVVVIQADLPASSLVLQRKVAENVAAHTDVSVSNLSIHATHTHSAPGQFLESDLYNTFGSNRPGFDPDVFDFLVKQMSAAVIEAYQTRRPAKVAIGETEIYGATKNRSMAAYVQNKNVTDKQQNDAAALRAVNPKITLVRLDGLTDEGDYKPMGAFSTFAIHGTGIPPFTHPYHGDVWAFFERELEHNIAQHYQPPWPPVHGPFEANHGDNNPNYRMGARGEMETRRIGLALAEQAWQLFQRLDDQLTDEVTLYSAMEEIDLLKPVSGDQIALCERAIIGTATIGAAKNDEVFPISYLPYLQRGWPDDGAGDCHKEKRWMMSKLQQWALNPSVYPHRLSISAWRLNGLVLVGLPFELTFEAGNRIQRAIVDALGVNAGNVVVSSHTNGYFAYSTTREEYAVQWYEGGSTIYGPNTTAFLAQNAARVVGLMEGQHGYVKLPDQWHFNLASDSFFPPPENATDQRAQIEPAVFVDAEKQNEPYWEMTYLDVSPSQLQLHEPLLVIEASDDGKHFSALRQDDGRAVDDQGYDLQIIHQKNVERAMAQYAVRWYNPMIAKPGQWFRFRVEPRHQQGRFYSSAFR